jgi:hypothetical protein
MIVSEKLGRGRQPGAVFEVELAIASVLSESNNYCQFRCSLSIT